MRAVGERTRHRHSVLQVRAAHLDHGFELHGLAFQHSHQRQKSGQKAVLDLQGELSEWSQRCGAAGGIPKRSRAECLRRAPRRGVFGGEASEACCEARAPSMHGFVVLFGKSPRRRWRARVRTGKHLEIGSSSPVGSSQRDRLSVRIRHPHHGKPASNTPQGGHAKRCDHQHRRHLPDDTVPFVPAHRWRDGGFAGGGLL